MKIKGKKSIATMQTAYLRTLWFFFDFPSRSIGLNELALEIGIAKRTANNIVRQLISEGFLEREVIGKAWRIKAIATHPYTRTRKVAYNLQNISDSGIIEAINEKYPSRKAIILFGSYRKGEDTEQSDIDIAVELYDGETRIEELGILSELGRRRDIPVNVLLFTRSTVDRNVFVNIANGIVLEGLLEVKP